MILLKYLPAFIPALVVAVPAHASAGIVLPEPSGVSLLAMGILGVIVGRRLSSRRGRDGSNPPDA